MTFKTKLIRLALFWSCDLMQLAAILTVVVCGVWMLSLILTPTSAAPARIHQPTLVKPVTHTHRIRLAKLEEQ